MNYNIVSDVNYPINTYSVRVSLPPSPNFSYAYYDVNMGIGPNPEIIYKVATVAKENGFITETVINS